jgi:hypothetical protein
MSVISFYLVGKVIVMAFGEQTRIEGTIYDMRLRRHAPFYAANNVSRLHHNESRGSNLSNFHPTVVAHCFCPQPKAGRCATEPNCPLPS